jgi:hypothetical protein
VLAAIVRSAASDRAKTLPVVPDRQGFFLRIDPFTVKKFLLEHIIVAYEKYCDYYWFVV